MNLSLLFVALIALAGTATSSPVEKRATGRTTAPSGCLSVGSSATYTTISSAISALGSGTSSQCIFIAAGTYKEQFKISYKGKLTLYGYTTDVSSYKSNAVTITHAINSSAAGTLDASSTVNIVTSNFSAYNINFENTYGKGAQAVAVTANGDRQGYYGCSFKGYQDTLYAKSGVQYYSNCYIEGAVDYIFGKASAWFGECTIASNGGGAITANSRESSSDTSWYVIDSSTITSASGVSGLSGAVYLGRPWRVLARVMFQNSKLTSVVNSAGWTTLADNATPIFEEYNNSGDGSSTSSRKYLTASSAAVSHSTVLGSDYKSWIDSSY